MKIESGKFCPLLQKECIGLECNWMTLVRGMNPNTGEQVDDWECAVKWIPTLIIEAAQQSRQAGAAVESFRNEVVNANEENKELYIQAMLQGVSVNPIFSQLPTNTKPSSNLLGEGKDTDEEIQE
jgi:hypothetical protein